MSKRNLYNLFLHIIQVISTWICTRMAYFQAKMLELHIGKNNKFIGVPYFSAFGDCAIKIGDNNVFRSSMTSNAMGINHKVMITCLSAVSDCPAQLTIGSHCGFSGTSILCFNRIDIGNHVRVGANSIIIDGDGHFSDPRTTSPQPIVIEDNVFIGANCVIKKGVCIGKNAVIAMNSVVTKDIPANVVAAGCPCRVIKEINC